MNEKQLAELSRRLDRHCQRGNDLVYEAYVVDLGGEHLTPRPTRPAQPAQPTHHPHARPSRATTPTRSTPPRTRSAERPAQPRPPSPVTRPAPQSDDGRSIGGFSNVAVPRVNNCAGRPPCRDVVPPVGTRNPGVPVTFRWKLRGSSCTPHTAS